MVGKALGRFVGIEEGLAVGSEVGNDVGSNVGEGVGVLLGRALTVGIGDRVGLGVSSPAVTSEQISGSAASEPPLLPTRNLSETREPVRQWELSSWGKKER